MNINEDADEKRGTTLRTLFWINEGLEQGLNERSRHGGGSATNHSSGTGGAHLRAFFFG